MINIGDFVILKNQSFRRLYKFENKWKEEYIALNHFKNVCLWFEELECRGEYAKAIFDSSISEVTYVKYDEEENPLFIKTDLFWIHYPQALADGEIEILSDYVIRQHRSFAIDKETIATIEYFEVKYKEGIYDVLERENNKYDTYKRGYHFMKRANKWDD